MKKRPKPRAKAKKRPANAKRRAAPKRGPRERAIDAFLAKVYLLAARELRDLEVTHAKKNGARAESYRAAQRDLDRNFMSYRRRGEPK